METAVINRKGSKLHYTADRKLLWIASLCSAKVSYAVFDAVFEDTGFITKMSFSQKLQFLKKLSPRLIPDYTEEMFDKNINIYNTFHAVRYKNKSINLKVAQCLGFFKFIEAQYYKAFNGVIKDSGIKALYDLNRNEEERFIRFSGSLSDPFKINDHDLTIKILLKIIFTGDIVPLFNMEIKNTPLYKDGFHFNPTDGKIFITGKPAFSLPAPESLSCNEIRNIRRSLIPKFEKLFSFQRTLLELKHEDDYKAGMVQSLLDEYTCSLMQDSSDIQEKICEQKEIRKLKEMNAGVPEYKVYPGFCTPNSLIGIYKELNLIDENIEKTITEELKDKVNMEACIPFLAAE